MVWALMPQTSARGQVGVERREFRHRENFQSFELRQGEAGEEVGERYCDDIPFHITTPAHP